MMHAIFELLVAIPIFLLVARFWVGAIKWFLGNKPGWHKVKDAFSEGVKEAQ